MSACPFCPDGLCPEGAVHMMNERDTERYVTVLIGQRVHAIAIVGRPGLDYTGATMHIVGWTSNPEASSL